MPGSVNLCRLPNPHVRFGILGHCVHLRAATKTMSPTPTSQTGTTALSHVALIIPTWNAARHWPALHASLSLQGLQPQQILIIDSSSTDGTADLVRSAGYQLVIIPGHDFRHGGTRQHATTYLPWAQIYVYMTQDAEPATVDAVAALVRAFDDPAVGAAYGRQMPRDSAHPIERHARQFNYAGTSQLRTLASRDTLGIKAAFLSNSFAAYRAAALQQVGGFPLDVILAEDSVVAARLLQAGWHIAYRADAAVLHSHALSLRQEFARYFDTGVHHAREQWLLRDFGGATGEGLRFVQSELRYLLRHAPLAIPGAVLRTGLKWLAYQLGRRYQPLPSWLRKRFSAHPNFWLDHQ